MKLKIILLFFLNAVGMAQVGIGTTTPNGALEVNANLPSPSTNLAGLLPPNVSLSGLNTNNTTTAGVSIINPNGGGLPANGTIVYNTNTSAPGTNQVTPGYYFWQGTGWIRLQSESNQQWNVNGNASTNPTNDFIGTTDNQELRFRTNNNERFSVTTNGRIRSFNRGNAAQPTYSWTDDTDIGLWSSGANTLNFSTNGSEAMRIDGNGRIGINTNLTTSKLKIDASAETYPSFEIVPRITAPTGVNSGQMAIINNSLFIYDATRAKWLSSETMTYPFGRGGSSDGVYIQYAGVGVTFSGAKILKNATIVGITAEASGGNASKAIDIELATSIITFNLTSFAFLDNNVNIDVDQEDYIAIFVQSPGPAVQDITVTLHLKWRE